jgi:hypothetical protein
LSTAAGIAILLALEWKFATIPLPIVSRILGTLWLTILVVLGLSGFILTEFITLGPKYLILRRQVLGLRLSKRFRLRSISNLRYQHIFSGPNRGAPDTIAFSVYEELGIVQHFGRVLSEDTALEIIGYIENYKSRAS